jgi:DNA-binding transcriptional ArsR family regulator
MSGLTSLHKILKDETRQKIITLLNDKGSLSYTDVMDNLEVVSTGLLNYHLKVLGDLLAKNELGQYMLTEKGKLASRLLLEFPEEKRQQLGLKPKWWRKFWIAQAIVATGFSIFFFGIFLVGSIDATRLYQSIFTIISGVGIAYMITHILRDVLSGQQRLKLHRGIYIMFGLFIIGFLLWIGLMTLLRDSGINRVIVNTFGRDFAGIFAIVSFVICYIVGAFVGNWIGKKRLIHKFKYLFPRLGVPTPI